MYGPPSSVNVEPSSDVSSAYGMKNTGTRKISQVKPCAPWLATDPIVSRPTSVQTRKKNMSKRPKCFWSLAFSSTAADVVRETVASVADIGPSSARAVDGSGKYPRAPGRMQAAARSLRCSHGVDDLRCGAARRPAERAGAALAGSAGGARLAPRGGPAAAGRGRFVRARRPGAADGGGRGGRRRGARGARAPSCRASS